ncbi:hypothetical protein [Pseudomonas sessilinigenes]|uniref:hypothetical protein n=1 Tax=Pseudomonas sessilinigenes TaxID=658629 RepID=UPI000F6C0BF4|nr:hypothetical protein [Pseudomonas sessilinigenes]AZC24352.1 hypothetical protein C4K39_2678 [Pseudomonas sessilinigenes]
MAAGPIRENNRKITLTADQALQALAQLEFIMLSLHRMGSHYVDKPVADYQRATTDFIDNERVTGRLAQMRRILTEPFDLTLGEDDMDDIERHLQGVKPWRPD